MEEVMNNIYHIALDFKDASLQNDVISRILDMSFLKKVCITEDSGFANRMFADVPGNLVIIDKMDGLAEYCRRKLKQSPTTLFIHLNEKPQRNDSLHLIGMTPAFFRKSFHELLGVCYMLHLVRISIGNVEGTIKNL